MNCASISSTTFLILWQISLKMRISSAFSSAMIFSNSLASPIISNGSINAVSPDLETSCTTPDTCPFESILMGMTHLSDLFVTKLSCKKGITFLSLTISSNLFFILPSRLLIRVLRKERVVEAASRIFPSLSRDLSIVSSMPGNPVKCDVNSLNKGRPSLSPICKDTSEIILRTGIKAISSLESRTAPSGFTFSIN